MSKQKCDPEACAFIEAEGGVTKLADRLGLGPRGVQRVSNWRIRGIPARVKLDFPEIFLRPVAKRDSKATKGRK